MTGLAADLATLRRILPGVRSGALDALRRVEAELSRLTQERNAALRDYATQFERRETAERALAGWKAIAATRLRDIGLLDAALADTREALGLLADRQASAKSYSVYGMEGKWFVDDDDWVSLNAAIDAALAGLSATPETQPAAQEPVVSSPGSAGSPLDRIEAALAKRSGTGKAWNVSADDVWALVAVARAAEAYRIAEQESDRTGEWEPAREAAVVLDEALAVLSRSEGRPWVDIPNEQTGAIEHQQIPRMAVVIEGEADEVAKLLAVIERRA